MAFTQYLETVQTVYIAYYQRPADPAGLRFWAEKLEKAGGDLKDIIDAFANSDEAKALYPTINSTTVGSVIDAVYDAFFARTPDAAGKKHYEEGFKSGKYSVGSLVLDILNGSKATDIPTISSKMATANAFTSLVAGRELTDPKFGDVKAGAFHVTYKGSQAAQAARAFLSKVTAEHKPTEQDITKVIKTTIAEKTDPIVTGAEKPTEPG